MYDSDFPDQNEVAVNVEDARKSARSAISMFLHTATIPLHPSLAKPESVPAADFHTTGTNDGMAGSLNDAFPAVVGPLEVESVVPIYDVSGRLLFRDFIAQRTDGIELRVRTAADKRLGAPVFSVGANAPLHIYEAVARANEVAQKVGVTPADPPEAIVCYSYPKLGLLCRDAKGRRSVVDLIDLSIQPVDNAPEGVGDPELVGAVSLLHGITPPMVDTKLKRFESFHTALSRPSIADAPEGGKSSEASAEQKIVEGISCIMQENRVWCAVATAKMILDFYGFEHEQTEIAVTMSTGPDGTPSEPNQVDGYKQLSENAMVASYDQTATFAEAQSELNAGRPLKSGIPGHARAVVGWKNDPAEGDAGAWLYIFDPWQGAKVWEKWGAVEMLNFIYVRQSQIS